MRPLVFRCPAWLFGLLIVGALAPLGTLPLVPALDWSPVTAWILAGAACFMVVYALTLLSTKLVVSDDGLCQKQPLSEWRLPWSDLAEWRYIRAQEVEGFWVWDQRGKKYELKKWLVCGRRRSQQLADVLRQKGVIGSEEYDG